MHYSAIIKTSASPDQAARAIVEDLELWWSTRIERRPDGFKTRFNNSHATFRFEPGKTPYHFNWLCTDANMIIEGVDDTSEWVGTRLLWHITSAEAGSEIQMTHQGLTPSLPCFDICVRGWQHFFEISLRNHLNGDQAAPNTD